MTLSLLTKSMVLHFKKITNGLSRFPVRGEVKGQSELERIVSEYQQRVGVSLESVAHFETVREIVLARNSVFHGDGPTSKDYHAQLLQFPQGEPKCRPVWFLAADCVGPLC